MHQEKKLEGLDTSYKDHLKYKEVFICSNRLLNTEYIFQSQEGWAPLVIRKSRKNEPLVWLSTKLPEDDKYIEIIRKNSIVFEPTRVNIQVSKYGFCITFDNKIICEAGDGSDNSIEVFQLDLRPLGLNIYGDYSVLNFGNSKMSRNTSSNSKAMFGI
ncbi:hypothetical protein Q5M49_05645 [Acinetobacter nosocomialis]|uniref:hypothetical protein n=1 Tax=Acinetobacter nosocomialis TaxID=106654 RepID=UPI001250B0CB|nr:hypothetical protein [Acinetobacter nosocomialis]MDO7193169.1 hypothetical protein [Acinetobacter nosocomialis]